jgi:hypothetical protein
LVPPSTLIAQAKTLSSEVTFLTQTKSQSNRISSQLDRSTIMSDLSVADFRRKKEHKVEKMERTREEQELKEQQRLDEEEIEFGTLDDTKEEPDDYGKPNCLSSLFALRPRVTSYVY